MKNILLISIAFCILFLFSCKHDVMEMEEEPPVHPVHMIYDAGDQEFGWAKGMKAGKDWEASGQWRFYGEDSTIFAIEFFTFKYGLQREQISLSEIPLLLGKHEIKGLHSNVGDGYVGGSFGLWEDGDALIGYMLPNENEEGYIIISEIDTISNTIKGFFELYFISEDEALKLEITNGEFEVRPYEE